MSSAESPADAYLGLARELVGHAATAAVTHAAAELLRPLLTCHATRACAYYWYFLVAFFGLGGGLEKIPEQVHSWDALFFNFSARIRRARGHELADLSAQLNIYSKFEFAAPERIDAESVFLVYGHDESYAKSPLVEPFVRHLACYAAVNGMRFVNAFGAYTSHVHVARLSVFAPYGHVFARGPDAYAAVQPLMASVSSGQLERAGELRFHEEALDATCEHRFQKIFAIAENLHLVGDSGLLVYYDMDVSLRPDAATASLPRLLLLDKKATHGRPGHVFISDTWPGTGECVNGGFIAVRNTGPARLFLKLWLEKLRWSLPEDQVALAETVLEIVGAEMSKFSKSKIQYNHECLDMMFPAFVRKYFWGRYCSCWTDALTRLIGPYRRRNGKVISFVDPEYLEVNYVPNSLFFDHGHTLRGMRLQPQLDGRPALRPFAIHWAGLKPQYTRKRLMSRWLAENYNLSTHGCPRREAPAVQHLGTNAREVQCCEWLQDNHDSGHIDKFIGACHHGCCAWQPLTEQRCAEVLSTESKTSAQG